MSNLKDDFARMVQLAEFGAKRHDERRQVEFRVFIAYMTLLLLGLYQIDKLKPLAESSERALFGIVFLLGILHTVYLVWEIRLSRALINDGWRRNFYLKKAECILHHLREKPEDPFCPSDTVYVTITLGSDVKKESKCPEKGKILESELFDRHEPPIELVSPMWEFWKHWRQLLSDWSRPFQTWIPTGTLLLFIFQLVDKSMPKFLRGYIWISIGISLLLLVGFPLLDKLISMLIEAKKKE